jgi:hypothetical protein
MIKAAIIWVLTLLALAVVIRVSPNTYNRTS